MTAPTPPPLPERGIKRETALTVPGGEPNGGTLTVPLLLVGGAHDGPRLAVLGGVHGDEYEGIVAAGAVWRDLSPDRLRGSVALDAGIPCLYAECGGGGRVRPQDVRDYRAGVQRVLAHLGMIDHAAPAQAPTLRLRSDGNTDHAQAVSHAGLLLHRVRLLDPVTPGQPLGDVLDERGATLETLYAPAIGRVIMARRTARVSPADGAYLLATEAPPDEDDDPT